MISHRNVVLMCTIFLLLKILMEGVHLKLVKDILRTFQNLDFICGVLFGILRSIRLQKFLATRKMDGVCTLHCILNVLLY